MTMPQPPPQLPAAAASNSRHITCHQGNKKVSLGGRLLLGCLNKRKTHALILLLGVAGVVLQTILFQTQQLQNSVVNVVVPPKIEEGAASTITSPDDELEPLAIHTADYFVKNCIAEVPPGTHFVRTRTDRSGNVILDMLTSKAFFTFDKPNDRFGGACPINNLDDRLRDHQILLHAVGLHKAVPLACPCNLKLLEGKRPKNPHFVTHSQVLRRDGVTREELLTLDYRRSLPVRQKSDQQGPYSIVVHIRRGDLHPCSKKHGFRYMTNEYYKDMIAHYTSEMKDRDVEVTIFSESESAESWDDFTKNEHWNLRLDTPIAEVWRGIVGADVFVMSGSTFSFVPALLNVHGTIVYGRPVHQENATEGWTSAPQQILNQEAEHFRRLHNRLCIKGGIKVKL